MQLSKFPLDLKWHSGKARVPFFSSCASPEVNPALRWTQCPEPFGLELRAERLADGSRVSYPTLKSEVQPRIQPNG
jgi:hypothetical protein